ncbi:MAG: glycosyltransferase family 2 protein [Alphaproteobacteria bacterium]
MALSGDRIAKVERRLTIGVIARDGLPFLHDCLKSIPQQLDDVDKLEIILVDSASSDGTTEAMSAFAAQRGGVRVFRMEGRTNAAATRNVILDNAAPGAVLLVDGDIVLTQEFLLGALQAVREGRGDAVSGGLTEIQHDKQGEPITEEFWRTEVPKEVADYGRWACGTILLSQDVLKSGVRYDDSMRLNEDRDFTIRLANRFKVLSIPISMGCHLTRSYYSADRLKQFYKDANYQWLGMLLRKHILRMKSGLARTLVAILGAEKGVFLGLAIQLIVIVGLLSGQTWLAIASLMLAIADFARFAWQRRLAEYVPLRVVGPWMVLAGLVAGRRVRPDFEVHQLV